MIINRRYYEGIIGGQGVCVYGCFSRRRKNLHTKNISTAIRRIATIPNMTSPTSFPVFICVPGGTGVGEIVGVGVISGVGTGVGAGVGVSVGVGVELGVIVGERVVEAVRFRGILRPVSHVPVSKA